MVTLFHQYPMDQCEYASTRMPATRLNLHRLHQKSGIPAIYERVGDTSFLAGALNVDTPFLLHAHVSPRPGRAAAGAAGPALRRVAGLVVPGAAERGAAAAVPRPAAAQPGPHPRRCRHGPAQARKPPGSRQN